MAEKPVTEKTLRTTEELTELLQTLKSQQDAVSAAWSQMATATRGSAQALEYQSRAMRAQIKGQTEQIDLLQRAIQANQGNKNALEDLQAALKKATQDLKNLTDQLQAQQTVNTAAEKGYRNLAGALGISTDATENFLFQLASMASKASDGTGKINALESSLKAAGMAANTAANYIEQAMVVILKKAWDITVGINDAQAQFAQTIGATNKEMAQFNNQIQSVTYAQIRAGVTAEDVAQAYSALYSRVTAFSSQSVQTQQVMAETVTILGKTGTSAEIHSLPTPTVMAEAWLRD